jgi:hypothetical protein
MTHIAISSVVSLVVMIVFSTRVSWAEVWECSQPNGTRLYTNQPQVSDCEKFEPGSELIYLPPRVWTDPPTTEAAGENQLAQPEVPTASKEAEQTVPSSNAREGDYPSENSFWSFPENRIYTGVYTYTYVPRFYGIRPSRPRHHIPLFRQAPPETRRWSFRDNSVQTGVPSAAPQSVTPNPADPAHPRSHRERVGRGIDPARLESVTPNVSRQSYGTASSTPSQAARSQSPRVGQHMKQSR